MAQLVKNPSATWETWVQSLGWEDPLEKGKAPHSSTGMTVGGNDKSGNSCRGSFICLGIYYLSPSLQHKLLKGRSFV